MVECGQAPNVTLNCADGSGHVDWTPPEAGCYFDCKAYWTCVNGSGTPYKEEV